MLQEIQGKRVTIYLNLSGLGDSVAKGEVIEINDSWLKLKGKKAVELVQISVIKRITVHSE
jgi:hypothetical protein